MNKIANILWKIAKWPIYILWKIAKWPIYIFAVLYATIIPFFFVDGFIVVGDEEAIHERNIYSILLIEGRSNKHIKQALLTYPREKVVSHLRQQGFITLNVRLEIDSGFGSRAVIAANKNLTFIESLFGWQDYFYSVGIYNNNKKYLYSVRTYYNAAGAGPRDYRHNDEIIIRRNPLKIEYNANGKAKIIKQGE